MSKICNLCGKRPVAGHNVSHSKRRTKRRFLPNLVSKKFGGKKVLICTACLRTLKKPERIKDSELRTKETEAKDPSTRSARSGPPSAAADSGKVEEVKKPEKKIEKKAETEKETKKKSSSFAKASEDKSSSKK